MSTPPSHKILVVDDRVENVKVVSAHLRMRNYETLAGYNGIEAIALAVQHQPDLILLDVNMPGMDGLTACGKIKGDERTRHIPVILVTAQAETEDVVRGLEFGADDYLSKPYRPMELMARVRSALRIHDAQTELRRVNQQLDALNRELEERVLKQVEELEKANRLRRFFSPQLVDGILTENPDVLKEHRREISIVFLDLRNFTSFAEFATPQEVIATIRELHTLVGPIIFKYRGTLERFTGDGLMVFLGDPEPMPDHAFQAAKMTLEIRDQVELLRSSWSQKGYDLGLGIGIASGEASLGTIGFEGRRDYAAIGVPTNLAARLCGKAAGGQILLSQRSYDLLDNAMEAFPVGEIDLKGFSMSQAVYELIG